MHRVVKPKNQKAKRALKQRAPKLIENTKKCILLKGSKTSEVISCVLKDLHTVKKPDSVIFNRRHQTHPFEDQSSVEFLCRKNDCSLFAFGSHSKKRPHNLILGRCFDFQVLNMYELAVDQNTFHPTNQFSTRKAKANLGSKPLLQFNGPEWENDPKYKDFKNFLIDYFRGAVPEHVNLAGLDRVIVCSTGKEGQVCFRHFAIAFKKSGTKTPRVALDEIGPSMDLTFRRCFSASLEVQKRAMKQPKQLKMRKQKNVSIGLMGHKVGQIHMDRQNLEEIATKRFKGRKRRKVETEAKDEMDVTDDAPEKQATEAVE